MRVLLVSCVFPPEPIISAQTSAQIAEELAGRGHAVTVVTAFPSHPGGRLYPGYRQRLLQRERQPPGVEVVRCFSVLSHESQLASRFVENLSFGLVSAGVVLFSRRPDVIYANTWPLFAAALLWLVARLRRIPLVVSVQDVYPETLDVQKRLRDGSPIMRLLKWLDGTVARGSQAVIVISERFARIYRQDRGVPAERVHLAPNWAEEAGCQAGAPSPEQVRSRHGIPVGAFVLAYGGKVGVAAGVETVIEAWRCLGEAGQGYLLIAGDGDKLADCREQARALKQVKFQSPWPVEETVPLLAAADVLILPTRGSQSAVSVPSKLAVYLLAGRPVLALALPDSDLAEAIHRAGCGWVVPPDDPPALAAKIVEVAALPNGELQEKGRAGRDYALQNLSRHACLPRVIRILESYDG